MKRQLSLVLALVMILGSFSSVFAAVPTTIDGKAAFLAEKEVLKGNQYGDLKLEDNLKRRDAVVLLSRLYGVEAEAKATNSDDLKFEDITDDYYKGFIAWSVNEGIVEGFSETEFAFNKDVKAQDFATMLLRVLKHEVNGDAYKEALADAEVKGILEGLKDVEKMTTTTRGMAATMTFNALGVEVKGTGKTLAETLGIEMPAPDKPTELKVEKVYTENLAEIRVALSNVELVKTEDALYNPSNYRLAGTDAKVQHVHVDGDEVVLTLVPYGKVQEQPEFEVLRKGKLFNLTIRNIHRDINKNYNNNTPVDNAIPTVENVDFMGDYGIKITTSEPIANPLERNFSLDSRTAMIVEQYGRDIILTPYHGKAFDKDAVELTIDLLDDFAGYRTVKTTEKMELSTDEDLPKVEKSYRSGNKLVVEFDRDVYHKSVEAYESKRELGNVSFVEKRASFFATEAVKVDTNVVEYTFEREIPKGMEITVEGVANHFNKTMEKDVRVPEEYKDDFAPVVISTNHNVAITSDEDARLVEGLTGTDKEKEEQLKERLDNGFEATTAKTTVIFDKDIAQFEEHIKFVADNSKGRKIDVKDFFTLYELDITRRGENAAKDVEIIDVKVLKDRIELSYEKIKVNNKDRDFDYILEVRNLSDLNGNRMDREYLDFQVLRPSDSFDVTVKDIRTRGYFNRDGIEIVLEFNDYVNKEEASIAKNYYLDSKLDVDEAIVERDGKTVSLVIYDYKTVASFLADYEVLEVSPRVERLSFPYPSVANRFWNLRSNPIVSIEDPAKVAAAEKALATAIDNAEKAITELPTVITLDEKADVEAARALVDKVNELDSTAVVSNEAILVAAENKIEELEGLAEGEEAADKLAAAKRAVVIAETLITQADVDVAKALVEALADTVTEKAGLLVRLTAVQDSIDLEVAKEAIDGKTVDVENGKATDDATVLAAIKALAVDNDIIQALAVGDISIAGTVATVTLDVGVTASVTINELPLATYIVTIAGDAVETTDYTIAGVPAITDLEVVDKGTVLTITALTAIEVNGISVAAAATIDITVNGDITITINK